MKEWVTDDSGLKVCDVRDFLKMKVPPRDMLMSPWLESSSLAMIYAARGVGKTHVALNVAHALATGGNFLSWSVAKAMPVLYVDGEMPASAMQKRIGEIIKATGKEPEPDMFRFVSRDMQPLADMPNLARIEGQTVISDNIGDARVVILDNLSSLIYGAKENEAEGWEPVAQWAIRERARGRSLIFIHHAGKNGDQRGSSKREDLLDVVLQLKWPDGYQRQEGARFEVHFGKCRSLFGNDARPFEARLGMDENGKAEWTTDRIGNDPQLLALREQGKSLAEIGKQLGCNKSTVKRKLDKLSNAA